MTVHGKRSNVWTTLPKTREARERNKTSIRLASIVQAHLCDKGPALESYKTICWRSSSVVVAGRRICSLTDTKLDVDETWFGDQIWHSSKEGFEEGGAEAQPRRVTNVATKRPEKHDFCNSAGVVHVLDANYSTSPLRASPASSRAGTPLLRGIVF